MPVIDELKELLRSSCPNDEKVSSLRVILDKLNTNNMGKGVNFIRPDAKLFASSTAKKLANLEKIYVQVARRLYFWLKKNISGP